jgi:hypothetical protein
MTVRFTLSVFRPASLGSSVSMQGSLAIGGITLSAYSAGLFSVLRSFDSVMILSWSQNCTALREPRVVDLSNVSKFFRRRLESSGPLVLLVFVWRISLLSDGERLLAFLSTYFIVQLLSLSGIFALIISRLLPGEYVLRDQPSLLLNSGCFQNRLLSCRLLCLNASLREKVVHLSDISSLGL